MSKPRSPEEIAKIIATPSSLAAYVSRDIVGYKFDPAPHLLLFEREILPCLMDEEEHSFLMLNCPPRHGKALAVDTPIATPDGWTTMGALGAGDIVYAHDGSETRVTIAFEPYEAELWRVRFNDNSEILCDADHLWSAMDRETTRRWREVNNAGWSDAWPQFIADRRRYSGKSTNRTKTLTTREMAVRQREGDHANWTIPNGRIESGDATLPFDPYLLGYWLGDGSTAEPSISVGGLDVPALRERIAAAGLRFSEGQQKGECLLLRPFEVRASMRKMGLLGHKHIPGRFLRASRRQRLELLAGLMDSDGYVSRKARQVGIAQQNKELAGQIEELVCSLGGRAWTSEKTAKLNGKATGKTVYITTVSTTFCPFGLQRKIDAWEEAKASPRSALIAGQRVVTSIEPTGVTASVRCIAVDAPSSLYLAGRQMVPTHNTHFAYFLAAWFLMMFPNKRVMYVTYGDDLSALGGATVKATIERFGPALFDIHIAKNAPKGDFQISATALGEGSMLSGMLSVGVGATLTGRGGDLIIIDDLIKNAEEAGSKATKAKHVREYDATIRSRLEPGGTVVLIATRWAEDDLPGTIQDRFEKYRDLPEDEQGDPWKFVELPAIAEITETEMDEIAASCETDDEVQERVTAWRDVLGRSEGDPLWPKRYSKRALIRTRNSIDAYEWSALYQQRPTQRTGGMFPKTAWHYYPCQFAVNEKEHCVVVEHGMTIASKCWAWDFAFTEDGGDWTVGELWGRTDDERLVLLEFHRAQMAGAEVEKLVKQCAWRAGNSVPIIIEREKAGSGKYVLNAFSRLLTGFTVLEGLPVGSKEERATPWSSFVQAGLAYLPEGALFIKDFHHEHRVFPRGKHDDQVDTGVYAYQHLLMNAGVVSWSPLSALVGDEGEAEMFDWLAQAGVHASRYVAG